MKNQKLFLIVIFLTTSLLAFAMLAACQSQSPTPAPTQSKKTSVTGTWTFLKESSATPDYAEYSDDQGFHIRQLINYGQNKTNDERLNGWNIAYMNFDIQFGSDGKTVIKTTSYGTSTGSSDMEGKDIRWICAATTSINNEIGEGTANVICNGRGKFQGLRAEYTLSGNVSSKIYALNGFIIE